MQKICSRDCFTISHRTADDQDISPLTDLTETLQRMVCLLLRIRFPILQFIRIIGLLKLPKTALHVILMKIHFYFRPV